MSVLQGGPTKKNSCAALIPGAAGLALVCIEYVSSRWTAQDAPPRQQQNAIASKNWTSSAALFIPKTDERDPLGRARAT